MDVDPIEDLGYAIDWYHEVVPAATEPDARWGPPQDRRAADAAMGEIQAAIDPLTLPPEIEWFWRNWDPYGFDVLPYPQLTDPAFALDCWRSHQRDAHTPRALFPIAYQSHGFLFVELGLVGGAPSPLWDFAYTDTEIRLAHASVAALLRTVAETLVTVGLEGPAARQDRWTATAEALDGPIAQAVAARHIGASPHAGRPREVPALDVTAWPIEWRRIQGIDDADLAVKGRTHTIAELHIAAARGPVSARLHGRWEAGGAGGGFGDDGAIVGIGTLSDETGSVTLVIPASVPQVGGGDDEWQEVDVSATGPIGAAPPTGSEAVTSAVLDGDRDLAAQLGGELARDMEAAIPALPIVTRMVPLPRG